MSCSPASAPAKPSLWCKAVTCVSGTSKVALAPMLFAKIG